MSRRKAKTPPPAREAALKLVAKRMLSLAELRERLERRGYSREEVDDAAELARSYGYVDDEKLAGAVVREAARTARGPRWVRSTLIRRGVADALAREAENEASEGATERIREKPEHTDLRIVALTAHALQEERERCEAAGMNGFLTKPFNAVGLSRVVEEWE